MSALPIALADSVFAQLCIKSFNEKFINFRAWLASMVKLEDDRRQLMAMQASDMEMLVKLEVMKHYEMLQRYRDAAQKIVRAEPVHDEDARRWATERLQGCGGVLIDMVMPYMAQANHETVLRFVRYLCLFAELVAAIEPAPPNLPRLVDDDKKKRAAF